MNDETQMSQQEVDEYWMNYALDLADKAQGIGEVPVGAVIITQGEDGGKGELIGEGFNQPISQHDATAHAEVNAVRAACKQLNNYRLPNTTLYVTLEPCAMCAGAIVHSRISRVVIATQEPRAGAAGSVLNVLQNEQLNHRCEVEFGIRQEQSSNMLKAFFKTRRDENKAQKKLEK